GVSPIIGAEVTLDDGAHLVLLARTQDGYHNLCRLISKAGLAGSKAHPIFSMSLLEGHTEGLIALSGCVQGGVPRSILRGDGRGARALAARLARLFGHEGFWIEIQRHLVEGDNALVAALADLASELGLGLVATNDVHYATPAEADLQDALVCIREHLTVDNPHPSRRRNLEYGLKSPIEMAALFADLPEAVANTALIARRCDVSLNFSHARLPPFPVPADLSPIQHLRALCMTGLWRRHKHPTRAALDQLARELGVIERTNLAEYFLIVHDIVQFAKDKGILCQGRGSAADSLAVYCLGITPVDPLAHNLLFDRFLNEGQSSMPDIDLDIQNDRREEVIQYVYARYGEAHTAMVCNVVSYRSRSALRDLGRVLGFSQGLIDRLSKNVDGWTSDAARAAVVRLGMEDQTIQARPWETLIRLAEAIDDCPRHLSIHSGGMIITARPLMDLAPLERATMPGRVVVQWNKDDVEDAGLIKIDLLGLGMLALIAEAGNLIRARSEEVPAQEDLPLDDPAVYAMLCRGDTIGCFQVESRAQEQMVHKHQPRIFNDIVVQVAIIRPGPIVGNMVHPYLRRRQGLEPVQYLHPLLEPILEDTLGIVLYQEQIIQIATDVAGFTAAEADRLRRAMSSNRSIDAMAGLRETFEAGCVHSGLSPEDATSLFNQIRGFGQYGFCRSHAACFALLAYQSVWLKRYHPLPFYCALLNNQPMGFYSPAVVAGDARRHGVQILPVDVRYSQVRCSLEDDGLRLGYNHVRHIGATALERMPEALAGGPFTSVVDFWARTGLDSRAMADLARVGAFDSFGTPRQEVLWNLPLLAEEAQALRGQRILLREPDLPAELPQPDERDLAQAEQEVLGLSSGGHPFRFVRPLLPPDIVAAEALRFTSAGKVVRIAGFAVCRQRPSTAHGFVFLTLEDETGMSNVIVRPALYERQRALVRYPLVVVEGVMQREGRALNLIARRFMTVESVIADTGTDIADVNTDGYPERAVHSWR
ncbi:MAG: polymerase subunit alpha, partial [Chloroflexi bacterium]|nr:polymerase subunit alpha [Chloroflexota bacterium]